MSEGWVEFDRKGLEENVLYEIRMKTGECHLAKFDGEYMIPNYPRTEVHFIEKNIKLIRKYNHLN
ncbi:MAG: hypothetical protein IJ655_10525 [Lachnospiraceae bacterium]|nr:hypothetical protein [Lachnospiraceae bacterium]MBR1573167.1 hypothetical protein [Lachnospiraceae bacterium]